MSYMSYRGSMKNKIRNNKMLMFARQTMSEDQFMRLYKSYRQLFWFQLSFPIGSFIIIILSIIIFRQYAEEIIMIGLTAFLFLFIFWLILSQFAVGKLWHQYVKLYNKGEHPKTIICDLFDDTN